MCREAEPCEGPEAILEHHLYLTRFFRLRDCEHVWSRGRFAFNNVLGFHGSKKLVKHTFFPVSDVSSP